MSLSTDIAAIVASKFPNATYILSSWMKANVASYNLDEISIAKPLIILNNELSTDEEIQPNANILADSRVVMWLLTKVDNQVYASDSAMNTDIEQLKVMARQIAVNVYRLGAIRLKGGELGRYKITPRFKVFNAVLSGVELEFRMKYNELINWCPS